MQQLIDDLQQAIEKQPGDAAQLPAVLAALRTLRNAISAWQGEPTACRTAIYTAQFDAFWRAYPAGRKVGKGKAFTSWQRAIAAGTDADTIITAAEQYAASGVGRVWSLMRDGRRRTLAEVAAEAGCSEAGARARLRDLRKSEVRERYKCKAIHSERVDGGLWVYWMES